MWTRKKWLNQIDKIKGIIYAKDVLPYLIGSRPEKINISDFCKDALFIPENKPIDDMLEEFRSKKTQIAIIVDEWGGTAGLVTVEDIVEEVFGEIRDPYDIENDLFIKRTDNHYSLDAKIGIYDIEEELDIDYPFTSLLRLPAQSWEPDSIPDWLKNIPITSRGRTGKINE